MIGYSLFIVHRGPEYERDFKEIAQKIIDIDSTIKVYYCDENYGGEVPAVAWERPTLVVALMPDFRLQVKRGTILRNMRISKLEQARRAREAGVTAATWDRESIGYVVRR